MKTNELMGISEIAAAAGVTAQAVSNWRLRADLPAPLATLASGPIWDGIVIRAWLVANGKAATSDSRADRMKEFVKNEEYTHAAVVAALGGETVSYLPQSNGRIVGGRFRMDAMNRHAPYQIVVGNLARVTRKAEMIAAQGGTIPVFMKEGTNRWRYHGRMRCIAFDTSARAIQAAERSHDRKEDIAGVLRFEDAR